MRGVLADSGCTNQARSTAERTVAQQWHFVEGAGSRRQGKHRQPCGLSAVLLAVLAFGGLGLVRADDGKAAAAASVTEKLDRLSDDAVRLLFQVYDYDPTIPLEGRVVERVPKEGVPREKIVFRGAQGFYVPGYLQLPPKHSGPAPCVLLLHGWSGSKEHFWVDNNYISGGNVRRALLAEGFAVFALDAQCHGDRIAQNEFAPVNPSGPPGVPPRKGYFTQQEIYVQTTIDYRRALDYLKGRAEIDSSRLGVFGYSMGGTQTYLLTAVEKRIKVAVACAVPADRSPSSLIAPRNFARAIGSRPFLLIAGRHDEMCPPEEAQRVFRTIGSESAQLSFYDGTHKLRPDFVPEAARWFKDHL
jgi:dienelactone hydrolase